EVEPREIELRELRLQVAFSGALRCDRTLELAGARRAVRPERLVPRDLGVGLRELGPQPGDVALGPKDVRPVLARIDLEQQVARVDEGAGRERDLGDVTRDARADLDAVDGF